VRVLRAENLPRRSFPVRNGKVVVGGGGGFIGGHLIGDLLSKGYEVRCVDIKPKNEWYQVHPRAENIVADLNLKDAAFKAVNGADYVYNLACNMGGMGFIEKNKGLCMISVLINTHLLLAAREYGVKRFFYASSACVYNAEKQTNKSTDVFLREEDAYPAMPEDGYGWEKLFSERMCRHFREDWQVPTRVARFHNVYGPFGTWTGGREKAPAAICRKVIEAKTSGKHEIEIWGDGKQTRSFMYISDCLRGIYMIAESETWHDPINLGSDEGVTINQLVDVVEDIAGIKLKRKYNLDAPKGVNGRNSDNTLIKKVFNWEPPTKLRDGMEKTYAWIYDQMCGKQKLKSA
jgi:nucleoside-diphosphate-sugar epimerase